ncbi:MAG: prefoldin subunit alpha [Thermoprotei archaeon]|nr:prefoldin subunit alpha [Thermoproteales archaeon]RLE75230.1 MAG: prefoldin subunit alpha [Thermoprotei archaeon]
MATEVNDEKQLQQAYAEYMFLKQLLDATNQNIALLNNLIAETRTAQEIIEEIKTIPDSKVLIVPLNSSILLRVKFKQENKVLISVGSNVVVEKNYDEALKYLQERENKLKIELEKTSRNLAQISERIRQLEIILRELLKRVEK